MAEASSTVVRGELVDLIRTELLGPAAGADEEIPGTPRSAYAVGALAPVTIDPALARLGVSEDDDDYDPETATTAISDIDAAAQPQPRRSGADGRGDHQRRLRRRGGRRDPRAHSRTRPRWGFASRCRSTAPTLRVTASWGRYEAFQQGQRGDRAQAHLVAAHPDVRDQRISRSRAPASAPSRRSSSTPT